MWLVWTFWSFDVEGEEFFFWLLVGGSVGSSSGVEVIGGIGVGLGFRFGVGPFTTGLMVVTLDSSMVSSSISCNRSKVEWIKKFGWVL